MRALVIGLGSMGKRRIRCLQKLGVDDIFGFDPREDRRKEAQSTYGISVLTELVAADMAGFDLAVISTPPDVHHLHLSWAIAAKVPAFVEASVISAPLAQLTRQAEANGTVVAPSCTLRFHSAVKDITEIVKSRRYGKVCNYSYHCGQYLPDWHPWEAVTDYYVSNPLTGGAREIVPFELTWLVDAFGWPKTAQGVKCRTADVGAPIDDTYAAILMHEGFVGMLMVDVVARQALRKLTVNFESASLSWDWNEGVVHIYEANTGRMIDWHQPKNSAHAGYNANIGEAMYIEEVAAFIAAATGKQTFPNSLQDDLRVLGILEQIEGL